MNIFKYRELSKSNESHLNSYLLAFTALKEGMFKLLCCNRVTALDWHQNSVFVQYLENEWTEFNQILYTHYH